LPFEIKYKVYYIWAWLSRPLMLYLTRGHHEGDKKRSRKRSVKQ
jgi:hypothetical protein